MESDLQQRHPFIHDHQQHHQKQMNSGLMRYQSAPSSYFTGFLERQFCEEFLNRPTSPETERIFARFLADSGGNTENLPNQNFAPIKPDSPVREAAQQVNQQPQIMASVKVNTPQQQQHSVSQSFYQNQSKPPLPDRNTGSGTDYRKLQSIGIQRPTQIKSTNGGNTSNLVRHSSSPAGLFSDINVEMVHGYAVLRGMGDFGTANRETCGSNYVSGFPTGSWDDAATMSAASKRLKDEDRILSGLNSSEIQNEDAGNPPPPMLAHHLSLPKTSAELSAIEKFLHLQDSVPCKIRAKRGCATHPRSIAERVRRTRISERMRKLQDLVPNMDKQTNTADMLDLAVDYINDLQRQVKTLSEIRARCTCTRARQN